MAQERDGGYCAIQCKCYAENTPDFKRGSGYVHLCFGTRTFYRPNVRGYCSDWSANLYRTLDGLQPPCQRVSAADLASRPVDWPDFSHEAPEQLDYQQETFNLREHQKTAFDDVINGFKASDRGKLIMACGTGKTFTALRIAEDIAGVGAGAISRPLYRAVFTGDARMGRTTNRSAPLHRYLL